MSNCCSACSETKSRECPVCGALGQSVPFETVKSLVKNSMQARSDDFCVCLTPDCDVVYFSHDMAFRQEDITIPVAWKEGAMPKFVCYCNRVTEDAIVRAVIQGGARTVSDIARMTGAMKNGKCLTNNPKGVCCHKDIESVIQRALESN